MLKKCFLIPILFLFITGMTAKAQFRSADLRAEGFTCALCSNVVYKALEKLPFIDSVSPDVEHASFDIRFKSGSHADPDAIRKAVDNAGFSVGELRLHGTFSGLKAAPDAILDYDGIRLHLSGAGPEILDGERTLTIIDRGFVTAKEYKKWATGKWTGCLQYGNAAHCGAAAGLDPKTRIYHVRL